MDGDGEPGERQARGMCLEPHGRHNAEAEDAVSDYRIGGADREADILRDAPDQRKSDESKSVSGPPPERTGLSLPETRPGQRDTEQDGVGAVRQAARGEVGGPRASGQPRPGARDELG